MPHRQILEAMTGLMLSMFVAMLSATVVSNALPRILHDLRGGQSAYTWVVTATLLTTTASTPLWGKLADLVSKKLLMQVAIVIFIAGSVVAGLSQSVGTLIACRAVQGIGAGGIMAMTQVIMAAMVSPRERGRYSGYLGATFAVATIAGPLIGGVIVDTSWLGWRWCFYVGVPFAAVALLVLQKTLHLPTVRRTLKVDYLGAALITGGVSVLLVWVSLVGQQFAWGSATTAACIGTGLALLVLAAVVELRVSEPIIPLKLFRERTVTLATTAGLFVGVAMYGATIFLSQYFQIARGESPTASGLRTMPMILGLAVASLVVGRLVSVTGRWKRYLMAGSLTATVGFGLLGTIDSRTSFTLIAVYMALVGIGLGMTMQNLVLSVQNTVPPRQLGAATATVSFFRSLGGAVGVSALGAVLAHRVSHLVITGLAHIGVPASQLGGSATNIPNVDTLPPPVAAVVQQAYGDGIGLLFLVATPLMLLAVIAISFIREVPLRKQSGTELSTALETGGAPGEASAAPVAQVGTPR
ncbi:MAG: MFS transporter [Pseudonocardiales bacterium]|nr:MAG: MFS transporter [Pseudonocardiales bacterium]